MNVVNVTKGRSWVYDYAEKIGTGQNTMFHCRFELNSGQKSHSELNAEKSQTTNVPARNTAWKLVKIQTNTDG
jgi:hypothetical protein